MRKFNRHLDHVAWVSLPENLDANVAELERLSGVKLDRRVSEAQGIEVCISWEAGLEIVAPIGDGTPVSQMLNQHLALHGESVLAVIFGVDDIEQEKARLDGLGYAIGPLIRGTTNDRITVKERHAASFMGTKFTLGEIAYADGVISFEAGNE